MTRQYSPRTFLRQTPNSLLKDYFARKQVITEIDFDKLGDTEVDPIVVAMESLSIPDRTRIEEEFRQINELACDLGVRVLLEEGQSDFHKLKLADTFTHMSSHYERAFYVFLNHPDVFKIASRFAEMDRFGGWRQRKVGAGLVPAVGKTDLDNLAAGLMDFYKKQARGQHCHVDNYLRQGPERHCYFAYPEDYATTDVGYDDEGEFCQRARKPAFEVIYVYRPDSGVLELHTRGKSDEIKKLQEIFCRAILGLDGLPDLKTGHFDLSLLKDKRANLPTEPGDGVDGVFVKMLRFDLPGGGGRRITFEASSDADDRAIYRLIDKALAKQNLLLDSLTVAKAKLQFKFAGQDGGKGKSLTFEISTPDRCTLKDDPLDQIAKKYIERWGFIVG